MVDVPPPAPAVHTRIKANEVMVSIASGVSDRLVTFTGWLVAGTAAILGVVIANIEDISKFIAPSAIGGAMSAFLWVAAMHTLQRYLAAIVVSGATASQGDKAAAGAIEIDIPEFIDQIAKGMFWPGRMIMKWQCAKLLSGDFAAPGRMFLAIVQMQGLLVLGQMGCVAYAGTILARSLSSIP